ncbi:MAG: hypothetical protein KDA20_04680 [Phycisphaerales bacterium]|nr:hypothetical protein [Phycisphaerales bacterium]
MAERGIRSPGYPAIDLKSAIDRARTLKEYAPNRKPIPVDQALQQWGYTAKSGAGHQQLASVKKFGLIDDAGSKDQRTVRLTELAWRILTDPREESPERDAAVLKAALEPKIHAEMRERWPHGLPQDTTIQVWLVQEKNFNERAVKPFLSQVRATFDYARVNESVPLEGGTGGDIEDAPHGAPASGPTQPSVPGRKVPAVTMEPKPEVRADDLPLPLVMKDKTIRVVHIPRMDSNTFEFFKKMLDQYKEAITQE